MKYRVWTFLLTLIMMLETLPAAASDVSLILEGEGWAGADEMAEEFDSKIAEFRGQYGDSIFLWMQFTADSNVMTVDGEQYTLSAAPKMEDGKLLLPIGAIKEALGERARSNQIDMTQFESDYITISDMMRAYEKVNMTQKNAGEIIFDVSRLGGWTRCKDGFVVPLWDIELNHVVWAMTKGKLDTKLLGAQDAAYDGNGMWVLQFDEYEKVDTAEDALDAAGIAAHTNVPSPARVDPIYDQNFADVDPFSWYEDYVRSATSWGLFNKAATMFEPDVPMTRAMTAQVLYNLSDDSAPVASNAFRDVSADSWFAKAVSWANEAGIVTGGNGVFRPNDAVTRQELVTVLYRYAKYRGYNVSTDSNLSRWIDADDVSGYAKDAMVWALDSGIVSGVISEICDIRLAPRDFATRAEVAAMVVRFARDIQ